MVVPLTPIRCLYRAVDVYGNKLGVVSANSRYTYAQFGERVERLAAGLVAEGIRPADRVAFLSFNNNQLLEGYYAVPLVRATVMPLNVRLTPTELIEILNHAGARMLIFENEFAPLVDVFRIACRNIERYVAIDAPVKQADFTFDDLLARGRLPRPDLFSFDENEMAELFYTSGSTGTPKAVMLSHRTVYLHALGALATVRRDDTEIELQTIPLFHANGWGKPQTAVMNGSRQIMVRRFDPSSVLRMIEEEQATTMSVVPVMANALLNCPDLGRFKLSTLRDIYIGGAASSPELIRRMERAFGCQVLVGYGLTETSPLASTSRLKGGLEFPNEEDRLFYLATAGWPVIGCEIRVVDAEMRDVPRDMQSIGEVIIRGDNVMDGYYKEREATRSAITDGWLHTGDMAVWNAESYIHIVDRKKDIIISGGENISSIELEKAIFSHPSVLECAVVAAPDSKWGEVPAAIVVLTPNQQLTSDDLINFLQSRVAKFKLPRIVQFVEGPLPKTGTGKIFKRELREAFWVGKERRIQGT